MLRESNFLPISQIENLTLIQKLEHLLNHFNDFAIRQPAPFFVVKTMLKLNHASMHEG